MTDREKAIITAYTGITMLTGEKFSIFHKYVEDILGRSVWTHELADRAIWEEIKEKSKADFLALCAESEPEMPKYIIKENKVRLIDANTLKERIQLAPNKNNETWDELYDSIIYEIDNAPTVCGNNPKWCESCVSKGKCASTRPQKKWIKIFENPFTNGYVCPFCGHIIQVTEQFLPEVTKCESCGADMKGGAV